MNERESERARDCTVRVATRPSGACVPAHWRRRFVEGMADGQSLRVAGLSRSRGGRICPALLKELLLKDTTGTHWAHTDLLKDGIAKDEWTESMEEWVATIEGIRKGLPSEELTRFSTIPDAVMLRFMGYVRAPLDASSKDAPSKLLPEPEDSGDDEIEETKGFSTDSDDSEFEEVPAPKKGTKKGNRTPASKKKDAGGPNQMASDLACHPGARSGRQLSYLSACIFLGRHATRDEAKGAKYGEHPVSSALIRKNSKLTALGMQGITSCFTQARKVCSVAPLVTFFANTRDKMIAAPDDHCGYAQMGAHRIGTWFDKGLQAATNDAVAIEYFELVVIRWPMNGRGLPVEFVGELMERAKRIVSESGGGGAPTVHAAFNGWGSCPSSPHQIHGAPAKPDPTSPQSVTDAIGEQLEVLVKGMESMQSTMTQMGRRLDGTNTKIDASNSKLESMATRIKTLEGKTSAALTKEEKDKTITCNHCKQKGHREADCPDK